MSNTVKPLVIYHANCADGFGAAFAAWLKLGDEAEYLPMQYGDFAFTEDGLIGREVYILDFSLPKDRMDRLFSIAKRVVWLDHHKTAFEMWCGEYYPGKRYTQPLVSTGSSLADHPEKNTVILDDTKSGAMIAWEYFHTGTEVPMLLKHIDDYDRWQFKIEGTKEFNKALWSYAPWSFEQWRDKLFSWEIKTGVEHKAVKASFLAEGAAILRAHDANVQAVVKGAARECTIVEYESYNETDDSHVVSVGLAANCPPHLASDVGHQLANQSGTYGLLWHINKEGKCLCSLRSNGDYDVSAVARAFGGGGHKNAAGFEVAIETLLEWIK